MIDLILICFWVGTFYAGWWCHKKFGSWQAMKDSVKSKF